jgi:hypothetical protein
MLQEPAVDTSKRVITKVTRERRADPLEEDNVHLNSEPAHVRFRVHRRYGWSDAQTQREI